MTAIYGSIAISIIMAPNHPHPPGQFYGYGQQHYQQQYQQHRHGHPPGQWWCFYGQQQWWFYGQQQYQQQYQQHQHGHPPGQWWFYGQQQQQYQQQHPKQYPQQQYRDQRRDQTQLDPQQDPQHDPQQYRDDVNMRAAAAVEVPSTVTADMLARASRERSAEELLALMLADYQPPQPQRRLLIDELQVPYYRRDDNQRVWMV